MSTPEFAPLNLEGRELSFVSDMPHDVIYSIPPFEVSFPERDIQVGPVNYPMNKSFRSFTISKDGVEHQVLVGVGREYGHPYSIDFRAVSPVNGIDYANMGFVNKAAALLCDSETFQYTEHAARMMQFGFVRPGDMRKIAMFNIVTRLPATHHTSSGGLEIKHEKGSAIPIYTQDRHPVISARRFLDWGIEHLDNLPAGICEAYKVPEGDASSALLSWDEGSSNYREFVKGVERLGIERALQSTFSVQRMAELGFANIRGVEIDYKRPANNSRGFVMSDKPYLINVFLTRSPRRDDYIVLSNRRGKMEYDRVNVGR
jgi:hypothetical protein